MSATSTYDHRTIESRWQRIWEERGDYRIDLKNAKNPYYNLMMFPYPSAEGLHVGNCFAFTGSDIHGRHMRLKGHDVFEPMGFDAFGIHSENFAFKVGKHPKDLTAANVVNFRENQLKRLGAMFDWSRELNTTDPAYYRWTQWIMLKLHEKGLLYRSKAPVNWCPGLCKCVLADSQVEDGQCERCGTDIVQQDLEQWFCRITDYAQRLLDNIETLDWDDRVLRAQKDKIGRSQGAHIEFSVVDSEHTLRVYTTRPDTLFGATYMVLAPEHSLVDTLTTDPQRAEVEAYRTRTARKSRFERAELIKEKTGVYTGGQCLNPATGSPIPIWIADYVLTDYGTGAIMAVPAHDERDFEFASTFDLPICRVIAEEDDTTPPEAAYPGEGLMMNSGRFDGQSSRDARQAIIDWLETENLGRATIQYKLRDWCISRQRYWGPPIPFVHCDACGIVPVPESDLPILLPETDDYQPDGTDRSPLARCEDWVRTTCPQCNQPALRDTEVSDNFLDSAWYQLRYPSVGQDEIALHPEITQRWLPVSMYIGGREHSLGHLLYFRFITMALHDMGLVPQEEPTRRFRAHGIITREGAKMSKSKGNVVNPDEFIDHYGSDTFRMYLMFLGPYTQGGDFSEKGIVGIRRFLDRFWRHVSQGTNDHYPDPARRAIHKTIQKVDADLESLNYNTAIAALMELSNALREADCRHPEALTIFIQLLAPLAPHFCEEVWEQLGHQGSVMDGGWPTHDPKWIAEDEVVVAVQIRGKLKTTVRLAAGCDEATVQAAALEDPKVSNALGDQKIVKVIYIPDKLINLVTA